MAHRSRTLSAWPELYVGGPKARECGGRVVVQDPKTAEMPHMPKSALQEAPDAEITTLKQIGQLLKPPTQTGR
jgi:chemotaxis response regulator CheB